MHGPPRLDHVLNNLLYGRVRIDTCIQSFSDFVEGGTQINRGRSGKEEMIEERLYVVVQLERRGQEIRPGILSQGCGEI